MLLIQNVRVLDPYTQMDALCDVLIGDDGVIAQVAEHIDAPAGCTVYDASGLTVSPGFVDGPMFTSAIRDLHTKRISRQVPPQRKRADTQRLSPWQIQNRR